MARTKFLGRNKLKKKLKALSKETRSAIKQAIAQGADELVAQQKSLAPVKSAKLRDSIIQTWGGGVVPIYSSLRGNVVSGDPDLSVQITAGNTSVRYARLIEFGTAPHINGGKFTGTQHPGTSAQPFFYPSYRALRRRIKGRITRAITKSAKKAVGK